LSKNENEGRCARLLPRLRAKVFGPKPVMAKRFGLFFDPALTRATEIDMATGLQTVT
jgi:hypothetical protein